MKRYFVTASMLALGALAAIAPSASADIGVDVDFVSLDLPSVCTAVPLNGTLASDGSPGSQALSSTNTGGLSGTVTVLCNTTHQIAVNNAIGTKQLTPIDPDLPVLGTLLTGTTTFDTFTPSVTPDVVNVAGVASIHTVNLTAETSDNSIDPGLYAFRVPLTITCD